MVLSSIGWGAFGALSLTDPDAMPTATHRYLCALLATLTVCAVTVYLVAWLVRALRLADDGYAAGYADGAGAAPATRR